MNTLGCGKSKNLMYIMKQVGRELHKDRRLVHWLLVGICLLIGLLTACDSSAVIQPTSTPAHRTVPTSNGPISYSTGPQDVLLRTFRGGGNLGTLELSPEVSIYGDSTYILGPGLQMRQGKLDTSSLQQLLHTLVDTDGLLTLKRQQFSDTSGQNGTLLQVTLNGKQSTFLYGTFGLLQENAQDMDEYHRLGHALTTITEALVGPTNPYSSQNAALLVYRDFSPDLTQDIPFWSLSDFTLNQLATYECGPIPPDQTSPNADTGCLTFTTPRYALLLTISQVQKLTGLLKGQAQGVFNEQGLYYMVILRPLLPDELPVKNLVMFGSASLSYTGVALHMGAVPTPTP